MINGKAISSSAQYHTCQHGLEILVSPRQTHIFFGFHYFGDLLTQGHYVGIQGDYQFKGGKRLCEGVEIASQVTKLILIVPLIMVWLNCSGLASHPGSKC